MAEGEADEEWEEFLTGLEEGGAAEASAEHRLEEESAAEPAAERRLENEGSGEGDLQQGAQGAERVEGAAEGREEGGLGDPGRTKEEERAEGGRTQEGGNVGSRNRYRHIEKTKKKKCI